MYFVLVDNHGSSLETFADRGAAVSAWTELVAQDPSARSEVAVLECNDEGVALERIDAPAEASTSR